MVCADEAAAIPFLTAERLDLGLVVATCSDAEREIDCFEEVDFSLLRARTVDPCAEPGKAFRRVVVLDLPIVPPCLDSEVTVPLGRRSGEETGETRVVVVKRDKTLSATRLILALPRL